MKKNLARVLIIDDERRYRQLLELHLRRRGYRVTLKGREVRLSPTEHKLLRALALNAGRVLFHEELLRRVWGPQCEGEPALVRNAIRHLRNAFGEDPRAPRHILTRRGFGYLLAPPDED